MEFLYGISLCFLQLADPDPAGRQTQNDFFNGENKMKGFGAVILNLFQDPAVNKIKSSAWILKQVQYDHTIKGFTLIELLVVVLIIGILSAVALPQYTKAVEKARAAELVAQTNALWRAQQLYFLENGTYAENMDDLTLSLPAGCEKTAGNSYVCGRIV